MLLRLRRLAPGSYLLLDGTVEVGTVTGSGTGWIVSLAGLGDAGITFARSLPAALDFADRRYCNA